MVGQRKPPQTFSFTRNPPLCPLSQHFISAGLWVLRDSWVGFMNSRNKMKNYLIIKYSCCCLIKFIIMIYLLLLLIRMICFNDTYYAQLFALCFVSGVLCSFEYLHNAFWILISGTWVLISSFLILSSSFWILSSSLWILSSSF